MKPAIAVLSLLCLALAAGLAVRYRSQSSSRSDNLALVERLTTYSNLVEETKVKLADQERLSVYLQSNLTIRGTEVVAASNQLANAAVALAQAEEQVRAARTEAQNLTTRLAQVEGERDGLQVRLNELASSIKTLDLQIAETRRKLATAEGDRDFLTRELGRLQADKAELVRQFNDVAVVRAQLALLKEEQAVNQRLAWMSQGVYQRAGQKGAEALVARPQPSVASTPRRSLDVELRQREQPGATAAPEAK